MLKSAKLAAAAAMMAGLLPLSAQAMPVAGAAPASSDVTLVAGGCGIGFHRGPLGGCRPNGMIVRRPLVCRTVLLPLPHRVCR